jgi:hypothetical protein
MELQEQIAEGSLKNSHRNTHAIILKKANSLLQKKALEYLSTKCQDLVICQRLNPDTNTSVLEKHTFYIHTYTSKTEPGFLVCMPNTTPIFIKTSNNKNIPPQAYILRFRFSQEVHSGSIFIVSIDTINHLFTFEDIYVWKNENIYITKPFTQRREVMKQFVQYHYISDVRLLGGLVTNVMNPKPLQYFEELKETKNYTRVHFIPESFNKRRFTFILNEVEARIGDGYYARKSDTHHATKPTFAKAIAVPMLPDVYELFNNEVSLGRGAIQQIELSKKLKEDPSVTKYVKIKYNDNFKRYEIIDLHTL